MTSKEYILSGPDSVEFDTGIGLVPKMFYNIQRATNDIFSVNIDTEEVITYKQLWDKTIKVASALQSLGLGFGKVLALIGPNNLESYSVYFGALFTGASVGCLSYDIKSAEIKRQFRTLLPDFVYCSKEAFTETKLALEGLEKKPVTIVPGGSDPFLNYNNFLTYSNTFCFPTLPSWDDHIYGILFSSGTTGLPKGTKIKDKSAQYIIHRIIPPHHKAIMTQFPLYISSSIIFLMGAVKHMCTYIYGGQTNATIRNAIKKYKPTYWFNSPSNMLRFAKEPDISHGELSSIQTMFCSGSGLTKDQIIYLNKKLFNNRIGIVNSYNCSEALAITNWPEGSDLLNSPKIGSVGKVQPLVRLKVINIENGTILGPGCEGELYVHTPFIMAGYINCPKETAEVLDAEGWYRTGDVGYYDEDGYVYITGRAKEIFKCMNQQVSPEQLEAIIEEHPSVFEAAIVAKPHPIDGFHPTAFVVLKKDTPPVDADELIKFVNGEIKQLFTTLLPDFVFCSKETFKVTNIALEGVEKKPVVIVPGGRAPYLNYNDFLSYSNTFSFPTLPSWDEHITGILFSSGSTGLPKGTMIKDKSLQYMQRVIPSHLKDILTQFPLCAGSSIIFLTAAVKYMGTYFYGGKTNATVRNAIIKYKPTYWFNSPSNLLKLAQEPDISHEDLSSIQIIFSSGAGLTKDQIIYLNKKLFNNRIGIVNSYNCIEALAITNWPEGGDLLNSPKIGSVGKLHPFIRLKVIDIDNGKNLGPGCEGEFYVHTPFIMAGYLNCPNETAKVLDAEGWYKTGDVGYYDEDGYVFVTGRVKEIFKCMNRQVSPAQLEAILEEHPAVFEAVIVGTPHPIDGYHPTAFVALKKDVPPVDADELIKFVNDQVVEYRKLYGGVYFVDKIPTTASGKKLRNKLLERVVQ